LIYLPISISNEELLITTNVKFTNQAGDNVVELESFLEQMPANKLVNYLPYLILMPQDLGSVQ
jgi:hypothetical protein